MTTEPEVYDLDVYAAEHAHAPFVFRWHGEQFELCHMRDLDWRLAAEAESGDVEALKKAFAISLGEEQSARWEKLPQPSGIIVELTRQWFAHSGIKVGESPASTDSSKSTARPSKPTSKAATRAAGSRSTSKGR